MAIGKRANGAIADRLAHNGIHYGWLVVGVTFLVLLVSAGMRTLPGVVIRPLEAEFGWDRSAISLAIAVSLFTFGLAGPFSGRLTDRFGPRIVMLVGLILSVVGSAAMLLMTTLLELVAWWGLLVGLSTGALAMVMAATVANRWFVTRRGFVVGILGAGSSAGQFVFVPAAMALTLTFGWRAAIVLGVVLLGLVALPLALLLMRDRPADVGLQAYGAEDATAAAQAAGGPLTPLSEAVRSGDFWLLAATFGVCGFTSNGLIGVHLIPHAVEHGFTENVAAGALALLGAMNIVGTTASGWLTDRYNPRRLLAIYYGFRALSLVLLPFVQNEMGLMLFAVLFGLDYIATVPPTVALTADRFGRRSVGTIFGWIFCAHQIGAAVASYYGGVVYDALGAYDTAFFAAGLLGFLAAALSLRISLSLRVAPAPA